MKTIGFISKDFDLSSKAKAGRLVESAMAIAAALACKRVLSSFSSIFRASAAAFKGRAPIKEGLPAANLAAGIDGLNATAGLLAMRSDASACDGSGDSSIALTQAEAKQAITKAIFCMVGDVEKEQKRV